MNYQDNDPKGWCGDPTRGAAMGRPEIQADPKFDGTIYLREVRIDAQGYDANGTYFGTGAPLFWYASENGEIDAVTRSRDWECAAGKVQRKYIYASIKPATDEGCLVDFTEAYIDCALNYTQRDMSDDSDESVLGDHFTSCDIPNEVLESMRGDCAKFFHENVRDIDGHYGRAGELFWHVRHHSGPSFTDDWDDQEAAKRLDDAAHAFGSFEDDLRTAMPAEDDDA